jgi:hypothetical protein
MRQPAAAANARCTHVPLLFLTQNIGNPKAAKRTHGQKITDRGYGSSPVPE